MSNVVKLVVIVGALALGAVSLIGCTAQAGAPAGGGSSASASSASAAGQGASTSAVGASASASGGGASASYTVECGRSIAGAERHVRLSDEGIVSCRHGALHDLEEGDGMSDSLDSYTFTGVAPGVVDVQVYDVLGWVDGEQEVDTFRLAVGAGLDVVREDAVMTKRFELREMGTMAGFQVYAAEPSDDGSLLVSTYWESYDGDRYDESSLDVAPSEVWGAFIDNRVLEWDGFSESDDAVLDGYGFSFEASLTDGTAISASGSNASPGGYSAFKERIRSLAGA